MLAPVVPLTHHDAVLPDAATHITEGAVITENALIAGCASNHSRSHSSSSDSSVSDSSRSDDDADRHTGRLHTDSISTMSSAEAAAALCAYRVAGGPATSVVTVKAAASAISSAAAALPHGTEQQPEEDLHDFDSISNLTS